MLTVHHLRISQSERIVWLCEELGIPYEIKVYDRDPATRLAPAEYKALHPAGTAPIITEGELVLPESGAIMAYIIHRHGGGRLALAPEHPDYAKYLFWFHYANGSLMAAEMMGLIASILGAGQNPAIQSLLARRAKSYALIEARLSDSPYLAGEDFTAADIINFFPLTTMQAFARRDMSPYPATRAYIERVSARPAYQAAMAKAEPGV